MHGTHNVKLSLKLLDYVKHYTIQYHIIWIKHTLSQVSV
jgi:hypothetical protein